MSFISLDLEQKQRLKKSERVINYPNLLKFVLLYETNGAETILINYFLNIILPSYKYLHFFYTFELVFSYSS